MHDVVFSYSDTIYCLLSNVTDNVETIDCLLCKLTDKVEKRKNIQFDMCQNDQNLRFNALMLGTI